MHSSRSLRARSRGVTLIELMVGLTIGLLLVIIASTVYLYSKRSYNAVSENSQMEENGRFALDLLAKYIQSAGFATVNPASNSMPYPLGDKLGACEYGFTNAAAPASLADLACREETPSGERRSASILTISETDAYASSAGQQQGFGCTNEAAASVTLDTFQAYEARSYFFISHVTAQTPYGTKTMGQLSCASDSTAVVNGVRQASSFQVVPLMPGIEQISVNAIGSNGAAIALPTTSDGWKDVAAIELCVLSRTIQASGNDTGTQYTDCNGDAISAGPAETFRTLRTTVALRNTVVNPAL